MLLPIAHRNGIFNIAFFDTVDTITKKLGIPDKIFLDSANRQVFTYNSLKTHIIFDAKTKSQMIKYQCYNTEVIFEGISLKDYAARDIKTIIESKTNKCFKTIVFDTYTDIQCDGLCIEYNYEKFYALICIVSGGDKFDL